MFYSMPANPTHQVNLRGGALDAGWPQIPVAHLSFETDYHFTTIDCRNA